MNVITQFCPDIICGDFNLKMNEYNWFISKLIGSFHINSKSTTDWFTCIDAALIRKTHSSVDFSVIDSAVSDQRPILFKVGKNCFWRKS